VNHTLVIGRRHLDRILRRYAEHYNAQRPTEVWIFELQLERPSGRSHPTRHAFAGSISLVA